MIDPRPAMRENFAHWLRVRAGVRALENTLLAAQHALVRDAGRSDDPDMMTLVAQLQAERSAIAALATELDERIVLVKRECDACEGRFVATMIAQARTQFR